MKKATIFWAGFIASLILFFAPITGKEGVGLGIDKLVHFLVLAWLMYFGAKAYPKQKVLLLFSLFIYTFIVEFIQGDFLPFRSFDIFDAFAGMLGAGFIYWKTK